MPKWPIVMIFSQFSHSFYNIWQWLCLLLFIYIYIYLLERECVRERKHEQGAWHGTRSQESLDPRTPGSWPGPQDRDLIWRQMLKRLSHQAPQICLLLIGSFSYWFNPLLMGFASSSLILPFCHYPPTRRHARLCNPTPLPPEPFLQTPSAASSAAAFTATFMKITSTLDICPPELQSFTCSCVKLKPHFPPFL